ncbi:MAG: hypothetical protein FJ308_18835 [Planctomycetes bacterium]|nr:hypothetical protein [Planctomycetota bacterium]
MIVQYFDSGFGSIGTDSVVAHSMHTSLRISLALISPTQLRFCSTCFLVVGLAWVAGCEPSVAVRVYDAPKSDTDFVSGPLAGSRAVVGGAGTAKGGNSAPATVSGKRRILGAVIPMESGCYFIKATDSPERLELLMGDFHEIVSKFAINESTGKPERNFPDGWVMNPRNDIAMAEFVSPESTGSIKFTVTLLGMPPASDWPGYLLSNINRWRGQLQLPELSSESLANELVSVNRQGSLLPGFIFDATGTGSGAMGGSRPFPPSGAATSEKPQPMPEVKPDAQQPEAGKTQASGAGGSNVSAEGSTRPELKYETPEGWKLAPGAPFRLATFAVEGSEGTGEVTVSMAVDNPLANSMMWFQQITREGDQDKLKLLAEASISGAEKIALSGDKEAVLYTIRDGENGDSPALLVVSIPSEQPELHLFVKLRGDNRFVASQRDKLVPFVKSLSLK